MNSNRKTAITTGILFIIGTVAGILSVAPAIDDPDFLIKAVANEKWVIVSAFFQFLMAPAYTGVAISLYPVLKKYNQWLAFGFAGFRIIAGVFLIIGVIILLLLLTLSQEFIQAGAPESSHFQTLGVLLRAGRDLVNHVATVLAVSLGGLMFYYVLYQSKLVPRWLSAWGLFGSTLTILASFLVMFRVIDIITMSYLVLISPMALQEMVLAVWLIVKGFNETAMDSDVK